MVTDFATDPHLLAREAALGTRVDIHDHEQLEIRFNYAIASAAEDEPVRYRTDVFFFVPRNVGLNRTNYSKEQFYGDVTALMRLDAPQLPLELLADRKAEVSPLCRFAEAVEAYRTSRRPPSSQPLLVPVKLYAYVFTNGVRQELRSLISRLRRLSRRTDAHEGDRSHEEVAGSVDRIRAALAAFRQVRAAFAPFDELSHRTFVRAMRAADEYMSLFLEEQLAACVAAAAEDGRLLDGSGLVGKLRVELAALAREEAAYRTKRGYLRLTEDTSEIGEYFTYSMSLLKKAVHQALYLDIRAVSADDVFLRNAAGAVAAALGAIWAIATQLPATLAELSASTKVAVFAAAVAAYVLKDRIKALTNEYLTRRFRKFDHSVRVHGASLDTLGLGMVRLRVREAMRFASAVNVPKAVLDLRAARARSDPFAEEVIHYQKELTVEKAESKPLPGGYFVRDILRLNVRHFLVRLDEPKDEVGFFDGARGTFSTSKLPKVYHLNVVLRVARLRGKVEDQTRLEHLRVVLNKEGIVRVDRVASQGAPSARAPSWRHAPGPR